MSSLHPSADAAADVLDRSLPARVESELRRILDFWLRHARDHERGGFHGAIANDLTVDTDAPKGLVLYARILWTFSRAYRFEWRDDYLEMATRALTYLEERFRDREYGGYYYVVDALGQPLRTRKQIYAHAFLLYGVSEYIRATGRRQWLPLLRELVALIERSHDPEHGGYLEAYTRDWQLEQDLRLSDVDLNEKKSMNTHLHVLEAYSNTLRVLPLPALKLRLAELVDIMLDRVLDPATNHFHLFFDADWSVKSTIVSFGHDIEGSWLLVEAAGLLGDAGLCTRVRATAIAMADTARREAMSPDGAIYYEARRGGAFDDDRHWWPQAEALVGFVNAYQLTGDRAYLEIVTHLWAYVESHMVDRRYGEWFWKVDRHGVPDPAKPKVSEWKCPYHNSRACFELLDRLSSIGRHDHSTLEAGMTTLFETRRQAIADRHEDLLARPNQHLFSFGGVYERYMNPVLTAAHVPIDWRYDLNPATNPYFMERLAINGVFNPGAIELNGRFCLIARVEGADRKSFFAVAESDSPTARFRFRDRPLHLPETGDLDTNVYDMRLTRHEDGWIYGLFCTERKDPNADPGDQTSAIAQAGIARTRDLDTWERLPDLRTPSPQQRNVVLHPEFVDGCYAFYTRPQDGFIDTGSGGGIGWGLSQRIDGAVIDHESIVDPRHYHTIKEAKNGQGPAPIKTERGWLHIAHGVRATAAGLRYVLYAFLTSLERPDRITHAPGGYLMAPRGQERVGDVSNVLFCNGVIARDSGDVFIYYASSDSRVHVASTTVGRLLDYLCNTPPDGQRSFACVRQRIALIDANAPYISKAAG